MGVGAGVGRAGVEVDRSARLGETPSRPRAPLSRWVGGSRLGLRESVSVGTGVQGGYWGAERYQGLCGWSSREWGKGWDGVPLGPVGGVCGLIRAPRRGSSGGTGVNSRTREAAGRGQGRGSRWIPGMGSGGWGAGERVPPAHVSSRLPQALVAELHRRALVEYVRPLLRGRLRCRSARTRSRMAGRLREDAAQLQRLFRRLVSAARGRGLRNRGTPWPPRIPGPNSWGWALE